MPRQANSLALTGRSGGTVMNTVFQRSALIDLAPVTDACDFYQECVVVNDVYHAVAAYRTRHAVSPPCSFLQPTGRGFADSCSSRGTMRAMMASGSLSSSLLALGLMVTR